MAIWLFDAGNSRLKYAPLRADGSLGEVHVSAHDGQELPSDWARALPERMEAAEVALVAPPAIRAALLDGLVTRARRISLVSAQKHCAGVEVAYATPQRFGVDRFLSLLAAHARGGGPWLVVGVGTALTVDLLDTDGRHLGGRIAASPTLMRQALSERAAQLPVCGGVYVPFAVDTGDALESGALGAAIGLIEHSLRAASAQLGLPPRLLLHGGGAPALMPWLVQAESATSLVLDPVSSVHSPAPFFHSASPPDPSTKLSSSPRAPSQYLSAILYRVIIKFHATDTDGPNESIVPFEGNQKLRMGESYARGDGRRNFRSCTRAMHPSDALVGNAYTPWHICTRVGNVTYLSPRIYLSHRCETRENFYPPIRLPRSSSFGVVRRDVVRLSSVQFDSARRNGGDGRSLSSFFIGSSQ